NCGPWHAERQRKSDSQFLTTSDARQLRNAKKNIKTFKTSVEISGLKRADKSRSGQSPTQGSSGMPEDLSMNNISELLPGELHHLRFLEELRLSGNQLSKIPGEAFSGLYNLKILMLQNNQLSRIPAEALWDLPNLQSLKLPYTVTRDIINDNNSQNMSPAVTSGKVTITQIVLCLGYSMKINGGHHKKMAPIMEPFHIPIPSQILPWNNIVETHDNSGGEKEKQQAGSSNDEKVEEEQQQLGTMVIMEGTIGRVSFLEPTQVVSYRTAVNLKQKRTLLDSSLWPPRGCRRLDANLISVVPEKCFEGLPSLRHLWLDDNALKEIPVKALNNLPALQAMTLALNQIWHIPDYAFQNLTSLVVLHLHNNQIQNLGIHGFEGLHSLET
ncbi:Leucine-rich repeat-containing G-protein coupled receptor 6, partial [Varanus komodoensis]